VRSLTALACCAALLAACSGDDSNPSGGAEDASAADHAAPRETGAPTDDDDAAPGTDAASPGDDDGAIPTPDGGGPGDASPRDGGHEGGSASCSTLTASGGTILDSATMLHWSAILPADSFTDSTSACQSQMSRLPTQAELEHFATLMDSCGAALGWTDPTSGACLWAGTAGNSPTSYACVSFSGAATKFEPLASMNPAVCVKK